MLETVWWGAHSLLWRLWSEPTNRMLLLHFQHHVQRKRIVLQELVSPFKLLNALGIFLLYTVDNLIQLFSFWSICFRQVSAWAFLWMSRCSFGVFQWPDGPLFTGTSVLSFFIWSPSARCQLIKEGKQPSRSLIIYCSWLDDLISHFIDKIICEDLSSPNWANCK